MPNTLGLKTPCPCDYAMNEACSAGTGSFLEESAKETLGIEVTDIAEVAFKGNESAQLQRPVRGLHRLRPQTGGARRGSAGRHGCRTSILHLHQLLQPG